MSEMIFPGAWHALFDGTALEEKLSVSALLATTDEEGWPHVSFLSAGEVLVTSRDQMRLTVWGQSTTAANMQRNGRAAFFAVADGMVVEARLALETLAAGAGGRAIFAASLATLRPHRAPYAEVEGLIAFRLADPSGTLDRWREQVAAMQEAG